MNPKAVLGLTPPHFLGTAVIRGAGCNASSGAKPDPDDMNFWELNEAAKHPLGDQYDIDHLTTRIRGGCSQVFCNLFRIESL